jgi:D-alanine-D-alanine ligase
MSGIDPKQFGKVAVLLGGDSAEREVSLNSGRLVLQGLRDAGIDAHPFDPAERPLAALKDEGFVRAFNALHGGYGENGQIQGALDFYGIRYTGSGVLGSALGLDKFRTKLVWQQLGIPTPPFEAVLRGDDYEARAKDIVAKLGLPLFVKPASEGSSVAVIKVKSADALPAALLEAVKYDKIVVVEKSIEGGGEYTACIAGDLDLPVIRIVPAGEFYDYHAKYIANDTQYLIPCGLTADEESRLKVLARRAFDVLGCTDWGRADFMLDADGNPYFLEVNTAPGMTDHSLPPKAARAVGISYQELVVGVLALTGVTRKQHHVEQRSPAQFRRQRIACVAGARAAGGRRLLADPAAEFHAA